MPNFTWKFVMPWSKPEAIWVAIYKMGRKVREQKANQTVLVKENAEATHQEPADISTLAEAVNINSQERLSYHKQMRDRQGWMCFPPTKSFSCWRASLEEVLLPTSEKHTMAWWWLSTNKRNLGHFCITLQRKRNIYNYCMISLLWPRCTYYSQNG